MYQAADDGTAPPEPGAAPPGEGDAVGPPVPASFAEHLKSLGPGLVMALTWLGAGDLVDSAVAGGNYRYALTWAMALAFFVRFIFVSILAKFQLCNERGESVIAGLKRLHPTIPKALGGIAIFFGHAGNSYCLRGAAR